MSKQWRWERREKKQRKKRQQMPVSGRSVFTIVEQQIKRAEKNKKED